MLFEDFKRQREILYERFDTVNSSIDIYELQVNLAKAISETEENIKSKPETDEWNYHLDRLYGLGDAIAWSLLDGFTIRQLGQYESVRTSLLGEEGGYLNLMSEYAEIAKQKVLIFCDLTRCITIGDILEVNSLDDVNIIECKQSLPSVIKASTILSGRNGRQFSKIFWLTKYLKTGFGKLYQHTKPTKTMEIETEYSFHFDLLPELVTQCVSVGSSYVQAEKGLVYFAKDLGSSETNESTTKVELHSALQSFKYPILAGTARLIEEDYETAYHFTALNFPIGLAYRKKIQEADINILGILDVEYANEVANRKGYVLSFKNDGFPALKKEEIEYLFSVRFINDILINFASVESAVNVMVALYEKVEVMGSELSPEEAMIMKKRPSNSKEMVAYLEKEYVLAKIDKDGNCLEAFTLTGEKILKET